MTFALSSPRPFSRPLLFGGLIAVGGIGYYIWKRYGGTNLTRSRALSAVTGGFPEDINQMPPAAEPDEEGPVYDGSQLAR